MQPLRTAVIQNDAGLDLAANLAALERRLPPPGSADLIALPEVFAVRGDTADLRAAGQPLDGPLAQWLSGQAARRRAWLLAGSMVESTADGCYNTSLLFDRRGATVAVYRKMHLFEAHLEDGRLIREADAYLAGEKPVMARIEGWNCGLSVCYDVRFPELFRHYASAGAHLLFVPSNFTQRTGRDHWDVLVRARAIENQCFVVAPGQCGTNRRTGVTSHGHSLVIGPWGEVLAAAGTDETRLDVTLEPELLKTTRRRVPALRHRRL